MLTLEKNIPIKKMLEEFEKIFSNKNRISLEFNHYVVVSSENSGWYNNNKLDRRSIGTFEELRFIIDDGFSLCLLNVKDFNLKGLTSIIKHIPNNVYDKIRNDVSNVLGSNPDWINDYVDLKDGVVEVLYNLYGKTLLIERKI